MVVSRGVGAKSVAWHRESSDMADVIYSFEPGYLMTACAGHASFPLLTCQAGVAEYCKKAAMHLCLFMFRSWFSQLPHGIGIANDAD